MATSRENFPSKENQRKKGMNIRWETVLSVIALLISIGTFLFSIQAEKAKSSPNVQVQSVDGGRERISGETQDSIIIKCSTILVNVGNASTQIVDVKWEFVSAPDQRIDLGGRLAISDTWDPTNKKYDEFFQSIQGTPIEGIKQTTLEANKPVTLSLAFFSTPVPKYDTTLPNIRVIFTFSNGQQIIVLPELKHFGVST